MIEKGHLRLVETNQTARFKTAQAIEDRFYDEFGPFYDIGTDDSETLNEAVDWLAVDIELQLNEILDHPGEFKTDGEDETFEAYNNTWFMHIHRSKKGEGINDEGFMLYTQIDFSYIDVDSETSDIQKTESFRIGKYINPDSSNLHVVEYSSKGIEPYAIYVECHPEQIIALSHKIETFA